MVSNHHLNSRELIKPLTSLRFVFAFVVFLSHLEFLSTSDSALSKSIYSWFQIGRVGVTFFFVLSGFVMSLAYFERQVGTREYLKNRMARIWPMHLFTFCLSLPLIWLSSGVILNSAFLPNLLLIHSLFPFQEFYFSYNAPSWSISTEAFFYLAFPVFLKASRSVERTRNKNTVIKIYLTCITALVLVIPLGIAIIPSHLQKALFYISPLTRIADFILGVCLFHLCRLTQQKNRILGLRKSLIPSIAGILCFLSISVDSHLPQSYTYSLSFWPAVSLLITAGYIDSGSLSLVLKNKIAVYLGKISFSFYLIHQLVLRYTHHVDLFVTTHFDGVFFLSDVFLVGFTFSLSVIVSIITYEFIESPVYRYLRN